MYRNHTPDQHFIKVRLQGDKKNRHGLGSVVRIRAGEQRQARYVTLSRGFMSSDEPVVHFGIGDATQVDSLEVQWWDGSTQAFSNLPGDRLYIIARSLRSPLPVSHRDRERGRAKFARVPMEPPMVHREREFDDFAREPLLPAKRSQLGPGLAYGDANGDGRGDLYLCGAAGQMGQLFLATSTGFAPAHVFADSVMVYDMPSSDAEEMSAVFFDLEGDRDMDLYIVTGGVECEPGSPLLHDRLLVNQGEGKFVPASTEVLPALPESGTCVCAVDFDRDGDVDLFVGGGSVPGKYPVAAKSYLLLNEGGKLIEQSATVANGLADLRIVSSALWSDIDDDGWLDLLVAQEWGPVAIFKNKQGKLHDRTSESGLDQLHGWWNGIAGRDLDNDGDFDYVVTNYGLNTKYGATASSPAVLLYGDFDGSGRRNIVEALVRDSELYPLRGKRASEMAMPMLELKFPRFSDFASATLNEIYGVEAINKATRLEATTLESGVLLNDGEGRFEFAPLPRLAQAAPALACNWRISTATGIATSC